MAARARGRPDVHVCPPPPAHALTHNGAEAHIRGASARTPALSGRDKRRPPAALMAPWKEPQRGSKEGEILKTVSSEAHVPSCANGDKAVQSRPSQKGEGEHTE